MENKTPKIFRDKIQVHIEVLSRRETVPETDDTVKNFGK